MWSGYVDGSLGCGMWVEYDYDGEHDGGMWWSKCLKHDGWGRGWDKCLEHEDGMWYVIFSKRHDHKGRSGMWVCGWRMRGIGSGMSHGEINVRDQASTGMNRGPTGMIRCSIGMNRGRPGLHREIGPATTGVAPGTTGNVPGTTGTAPWLHRGPNTPQQSHGNAPVEPL
ncbi:hypothetical protein DPMN_139946 [Dreissena polymorpha]|uniref:Uncharacterized protein n=1 Tax=Dreissena polymorpha TaxID=45954 RepID=A0A9D4JG67_DREPO|nr:hypothetical protein DPMN_139946 [Dreissena polymorpha]